MRHIPTLILIITASATLAKTQSGHREMRRGDQFYDQKNWEKAEGNYRKADGNPNANFNAGCAAFQQGNFAGAVGFFEKAIEKSGGKSENALEKSGTFFNLGNAHLRDGQLEKAIEAYENSLRQSPNQPDAQKNLQIAKRKLKEKQDPPPPPPPQKQPPPPPPNPQRRYLDRAQVPPRPEPIAGGLDPQQARKILENTVVPDEQKNLRTYRTLAPAGAEKGKKDW